MVRLFSLPAQVKLVWIPLVVISGTFMAMLYFNKIVIDRRLEELSYLLENASQSQDQVHSLEMLSRYDMLRKRATGKGEQASDAMEEAKLKLITEEDDENAGLSVPGPVTVIADNAIRGLRFLMGKDTRIMIGKRGENRNMYLAYLEERARNYTKAIEYYQAALNQDLPDMQQLFARLHIGYCYSFINEVDKAAEYYTQVIRDAGTDEIGKVAQSLLDWIRVVQEKNREIAAERSLYKKALKYFQYMEYKKSIELFSRIIGTDRRQRPQAYFYRGRAYESSGQTDKAVADYEKVIGSYGKSPWAKKANRRMYTISKFYRADAGAARLAEDRMRKMKDNSMLSVVNELQTTILNKKAALESESSLKLREMTGKMQADDYVQAAQEFMSARKYDQALELYQKALKRTPNDAAIYSNMGVIYKRLQKLDDAKGAFEKALEIDPKLDAARANLLNLKRRMGEDIGGSQEAAEVPKDGKSAMTYNAIGMGHLDKREYAKAVAAFKKAVALDSHTPELQVNLGLAYYKMGKYANAVDPLRKAATNLTYAGRDKANFNLGLAYQKSYQYTKAIEAYKEVLMINPAMTEAQANLIAAYVSLADMYAKKKNFRGMINCFKNMQKYKPTDPVIKRNLAQTYNNYGVDLMGKNKFQDAITNFEAALKIDPTLMQAKQNIPIARQNLAITAYNKGVELYGAGKTKEALAQFQKAYQAAPSSEAGKNAKQNIDVIKGGK